MSCVHAFFRTVSGNSLLGCFPLTKNCCALEKCRKLHLKNVERPTPPKKKMSTPPPPYICFHHGSSGVRFNSDCYAAAVPVRIPWGTGWWGVSRLTLALALEVGTGQSHPPPVPLSY